MSEERKEIAYLFYSAEEGKPYNITTWYRCVGVQNFVERVLEKKNIVGIIFSDNNLGFILDDKPTEVEEAKDKDSPDVE